MLQTPTHTRYVTLRDHKTQALLQLLLICLHALELMLQYPHIKYAKLMQTSVIAYLCQGLHSVPITAHQAHRVAIGPPMEHSH
jgi:hypothetical protein